MKRRAEDRVIEKKRIATRDLGGNMRENPPKKMSEDNVRIRVPSSNIPIQQVTHVTTYQLYSIYVRTREGENVDEHYVEPTPGVKIVLARADEYLFEVIQEGNSLYLVINGIKMEQPIRMNELLLTADKPEIYIYVMTRFDYYLAQNNRPKTMNEIAVDSKNASSIYETGMPTSWSLDGRIVKVMKLNVRIGEIEAMLREIKVLEELNKNPNNYIEKFYGRVILDKYERSEFPGMLVEQGINFRQFLYDLYRGSGSRQYYPKIAKYMNDIVNGVRYLHSQKYVHFDLKLDNLIYVGRHVKLIDFGFSYSFDSLSMKKLEGNVPRCGTEGYMAPEIVKNWMHDRGTPSDIWALGCILILIIGNESGQEKTNIKIQEYIQSMEDVREMNEEKRRKVVTQVENRIKTLIDTHPQFKKYDKLTGHKDDMMNFILRMLRILPRDRLKSEELIMPNGVFLQ